MTGAPPECKSIALAHLDALVAHRQVFAPPHAIIGPRDYELWQTRGDGTHNYYGIPPKRVHLSLPIGYLRCEYAARCWWLVSEWHR